MCEINWVSVYSHEKGTHPHTESKTLICNAVDSSFNRGNEYKVAEC